MGVGISFTKIFIWFCWCCMWLGLRQTEIKLQNKVHKNIKKSHDLVRAMFTFFKGAMHVIWFFLARQLAFSADLVILSRAFDGRYSKSEQKIPILCGFHKKVHSLN